MAGLEGA